MSEESKEVISETNEENSVEDVASTTGNETGTPQSQLPDATAASTSAKKKSKRNKIKSALGAKEQDETTPSDAPESSTQADKKLSGPVLDQILRNNPALAQEVGDMPKQKVEQMLKKADLSELLTGLAVGGKNQKDMASYKFWQTQPVPRFDEKIQNEEGPIKIVKPEDVPTEPSPLIEGFTWVTMDLTAEKELEEVYELLTHHYVEDDDAMFRFNYSVSFLSWALKAPGWRKDWHVGLRVRMQTLNCTEINFLCVHKKLRSKRLAPVLIKEITRRSYAVEVWQAIYTAGIVLPKPISTCRYYHRSLDWLKLYEVGFSPMPPHSNKAKQITKYNIPTHTSVNGLRPMQHKDVDGVLSLLKRYLEKFDMAPIFTRDEVEHWMLHRPPAEQVIWTYVVEEPESHHITDFFSFYCLESSAIRSSKHDTVRAAYLFYYATEAAFLDDKKKDNASLKARLNELMQDALILAKRFNFDVFNALTLLDNPLFLEKQKFGPGDGRLNYYLYNYRTAPIHGGLNTKNQPDEENCSGIGVVML